MDDYRREYVAGLREFADWLEAHPQSPTPFESTFNIFVSSLQELLDIRRAAGGSWEKHFMDDWVMLRKRFGRILYDVNISRVNACERRVTTQMIEREVPDPELLAKVPLVKVSEQRETVEWVCPESLLEKEAVQ